MTLVSREDLHRAVERLSEDRLTDAAQLLDALKSHDDRVSAWREALSPADVAALAASLRREPAADEWVTDEAVAAWIDTDTDLDPAG